MSKKLILNHKSYLNYEEITNYIKRIEKLELKKYDIILFPSLIYLSLFNNKDIKVGAQNFFASSYGSYTGEVNLESLKYLNIKYTLINHSERVKYKLESKEMTKEKLVKSLNSNFNTILCVGEWYKTLNPYKKIKKQLDFFLKNIDSTKLDNLSVAYEPIWAIGGSKVIDIKKIEKIIGKIRKYFEKRYGLKTEIYYGGSVGEEIIKDVLKISDGVLIGKISSSIVAMEKIINVLN